MKSSSILRTLVLGVFMTTFMAYSNNVAEALFEQKTKLPSLAICEVEGYGERSLQDQYFQNFKGLLDSELRHCKTFKVRDIITASAKDAYGRQVDVNTFFSEIHMNAMTQSEGFVREKANIKVIKFMKNHQSAHRRPSANNLHYVDSEYMPTIENLKVVQGIKYLLFINLKDIQTSETMGAFNSGNKVKVDLDTYLVDTTNGAIYAKSEHFDKSASKFDLGGYGSFGKTISPEQLLHNVLERAAKKIAEDVDKNGIKELSKIKQKY